MTRRRSTVILRSAVSVAIGAATAAAATPALGLAAGLLAGWSALSIVSVAWVLILVWPMDAAQTRAHATSEDPGRSAARVVALIGSVVSLGAVGIVLVQTRHTSLEESFVLAAIAVVAVASSWALIQVDYLLRYAHLYYTEPVGGIDFNQTDEPMYTDFAYFSLGLGVAYQVADTNVSRNAFRRVIIAQMMLAYLFGAVILATIINLVTGLG